MTGAGTSHSSGSGRLLLLKPYAVALSRTSGNAALTLRSSAGISKSKGWAFPTNGTLPPNVSSQLTSFWAKGHHG